LPVTSPKETIIQLIIASRIQKHCKQRDRSVSCCDHASISRSGSQQISTVMTRRDLPQGESRQETGSCMIILPEEVAKMTGYARRKTS
jgi:hypothetical protein